VRHRRSLCVSVACLVLGGPLGSQLPGAGPGTPGPGPGSRWHEAVASASNGEQLTSHWRVAWSTSNLAEQFHGVSCPTTTECLAVASLGNATQVLRTTNAGRTWANPSPAMHGVKLWSIACTSGTTCIASGSATVGGHNPDGSSDTVARVLITYDAGQHWASRPLPTAFGGASDAQSLVCPDAGTCFIAAEPRHYGGTFFYESVNGGTSWQFVHVSPISVAAMTCIDDRRCIGVGNAYEHISVHAIVIPGGSVTTTSAWVTTSTGRVPADAYSLTGVACPNQQTCLAVGVPHNLGGATWLGAVIVSHNLGSTWAPVNISREPLSFLDTIACNADAQCVAGGPAERSESDAKSDPAWQGILVSADAGGNWSFASIPGVPEGVFSVASLGTRWVALADGPNVEILVGG
jgi:photosystem II stability/assembly factor-like uncharacterized protein